MRSFDLHEPTTVQDAVGMLGRLGASARPLAGGSDLVAGVMKDWVQGKGMPYPEALVDLTTIPQLKGIRSDANGLTIGATTTLTELIDNQEVTQKFPVLQQSAISVASPL